MAGKLVLDFKRGTQNKGISCAIQHKLYSAYQYSAFMLNVVIWILLLFFRSTISHGKNYWILTPPYAV
jgi:hypothetical protein